MTIDVFKLHHLTLCVNLVIFCENLYYILVERSSPPVVHVGMIVRMRREWPKKSRGEIVEHEDWCLSMRNYNNNRKSLINDW